MKTLKLLLLVAFFIAGVTTVSAKKDKDPYKYELEAGLGMPSAGYICVKVWNYGKKEAATSDLCLRSAIEGVMFKGYPASATSKDRGKQALVPAGYESNTDYFNKFFESGKYKQFIQFSNNGDPDPADIIKLNSKQYKYKVGMNVIINYRALQKQLEQDNIIQSAKSLISD